MFLCRKEKEDRIKEEIDTLIKENQKKLKTIQAIHKKNLDNKSVAFSKVSAQRSKPYKADTASHTSKCNKTLYGWSVTCHLIILLLSHQIEQISEKLAEVYGKSYGHFSCPEFLFLMLNEFHEWSFDLEESTPAETLHKQQMEFWKDYYKK